MENILIVKTSALGDIVHVYPVVNYLRKRFPQANIDWVVETSCASLVSAHPAIRTTLSVATKSWRKEPLQKATYKEIFTFLRQLRSVEYDAVFDLQGNIKSGVITSCARGAHKVGFGFRTVAEKPNCLLTTDRFNPPAGRNIREDYLSVVTSFIERETGLKDNVEVMQDLSRVELRLSPSTPFFSIASLQSPVVMVCPGSAWPNKCLNHESLLAFLSLLQPHLQCHFLFAWGSPEEKEVAEVLFTHFGDHGTLLEKHSLPALQHLMGKCDLVIAMDSLPLHLASTTGVATYSLFGPSLAAKYKPLGENQVALQGMCPYGRVFEKRCPVLRTCPTGACLHALSGKEIFSHFLGEESKLL